MAEQAEQGAEVVAGNVDAAPQQVGESAQEQSQRWEFPNDGVVKIGDEEFPAQEFQKRYRSQADFDRAVQKSQEKLRRQYEQQVQQQISAYQQQVQQWMQQQQRPAAGGQQGQRPDINSVFKTLRDKGYVGPDDLEAVLTYYAPQFQQINTLQDQVALLNHELKRYGQGFESLQQARVSQEADRLVQQIQTLDPDLLGDDSGREVILDVLNSHQPEPGESLEDFKESIQEIASKRLRWAIEAGKKHQTRELDRARRVKASGIPGAGGQGNPTGKARTKVDPEDFAKDWFSAVNG